MEGVVGSIVAVIAAVIAFYILGSIASIATSVVGGISYAGLARTPARKLAPFVTFAILLALYLAWAALCWVGADRLAVAGIANRWILLFAAAALAGAPYHWAQRSIRDSARDGIQADETLSSALTYAGGLQSKIVIVAMLSGIYFDWWPGLPG